MQEEKTVEAGIYRSESAHRMGSKMILIISEPRIE
jgi:hypothetical protein